MGTTAEHLEKWKHNRSFLGTIPDQYPDWMVTVAFYTAVHAVEALIERDGRGHGQNHSERNQLLKRTTRYQSLWREFRPLFEASQVSRYECDTGGASAAGSGWLSSEDAKTRLVGEKLAGVESLVIKLLTLNRNDFPPIFSSALPPATPAVTK